MSETEGAATARDEQPYAAGVWTVPNLVSLLSRLKEKGIWVVGLDADAGSPWTEFDYSLPLALVVGGEEKGLRRLVREHCDVRVRIPLAAGVESLNVSVAAGIALFEVVRQRGDRRPAG